MHRDDGKRYAYDGISCMFRRYAKKCGLKEAPTSRPMVKDEETVGDAGQLSASAPSGVFGLIASELLGLLALGGMARGKGAL